MFCNRGDIKTDAGQVFGLCDVKCVGGEDPVIKLRAAEILMSPGAVAERQLLLFCGLYPWNSSLQAHFTALRSEIMS